MRMTYYKQGNKRIRGCQPIMQMLARNLRVDATDAEAALWQAIRNRKLGGLKFRRQHPVGRFVLDFYCQERKLVVELDGKYTCNKPNKIKRERSG